MLATSADVLPRGAGWSYEFKWDGVRAIADISDRGTHLFSRAGNEITTAYPELVSPLPDTTLPAKTLPDDALVDEALVDGEIVAFVDGRPSFDALQLRMHVRAKAEARRLATELPVIFMAFDLLRLNGVDLTSRPLSERRAALEDWLVDRPGWTISPSFDDGAATESAAREHGLEGVMAKRSTSRYLAGARTRDWVKLRFVRTGDFVVVGWEAPHADPDVLSSVVLAMVTTEGLIFAGKAGSGLTGRTAAQLQQLLVTRGSCPLNEVLPASPGRTTHWVEPSLVVEIEFATWTDEGRLRHPVFRRIREDKRVDEAVGDA